MSTWKGLLHVLIVSSTLMLLMSAVALPGRAEKPQPDVTADSLSAAARMSDEIKISPSVWPSDYDNYLPAAAYSAKHHQFLIVWHRKRTDGCREIWGRRVSEDGQRLSHFNISSGPCPQNRMQPAVAYNAKEDNYLVVWMYHWSGTSMDPNRIDGRTVKWDGSSMGDEKPIISWPYRSFWTPRVAWNSIRNEYMVVWTAFDTTTGQPHDVAHAVLNASGERRLTKIITTGQSPHQIDVTYNVAANEYFAVWRRMWTAGDGDIVGARINPVSGDIITPPWIIAINTAPNDQKEPRITTNQQHRYLVVWSQVYDPARCCDWDIHAQELDVGGHLLAGGYYNVAMTADDEESPSAIARSGTTRDYMVAWQRAAAAGKRIEARGWSDSSYTGLLEIAGAVFWDNMHPVLAVGGPFLIAYESDSLGDPTVKSHIFARLYWPHTTYLPTIVK